MKVTFTAKLALKFQFRHFLTTHVKVTSKNICFFWFFGKIDPRPQNSINEVTLSVYIKQSRCASHNLSNFQIDQNPYSLTYLFVFGKCLKPNWKPFFFCMNFITPIMNGDIWIKESNIFCNHLTLKFRISLQLMISCRCWLIDASVAYREFRLHLEIQA